MKKADVIKLYEAEMAMLESSEVAELAAARKLLRDCEVAVVEHERGGAPPSVLAALQNRRDGALRRLRAAESPPPRALQAFRGLRTRVHEQLQAEAGDPPGLDVEDRDEAHHVQKKHFKAMWVQADELVATAGITAKGRAT
jgi:hypothetical protein